MPEPIKNENDAVNEFFNNLPKADTSPQADILGSKPIETNIQTPPPPKEDEDELVDDSVKNRRHRRLESKIQELRDENIALGERVRVLSEVERFTKDNPDVDPDIAKMFDASDMGKMNALLLSKKLQEIEEKAEKRALARIEELKEEEAKEFEEASNLIDTELDNLEDQFGIQFYGSKKADNLRTEFLQFVEEISPKDKDGNLKDYADFESSFEKFQELKSKDKPDTSRQREIASRSMQRSQNSAPTVKTRSPGWDGWKKDFGLE